MPPTLDHTVTPEESGKTLPALLRAHLPGTTWSQAKELVESGRVRVDGSMVPDPATRVAAGSRIELNPEGPALSRGPLTPEALVSCDADLVVVNKPAGLLTVPFAGERDTLISLTRSLLARRQKTPSVPPLRAVQRLDKETSGLLVFARTVPGLYPAGSTRRQQHYGIRSEKLAEFGLQPFRGRKQPGSAAPPPTPSTTPEVEATAHPDAPASR